MPGTKIGPRLGRNTSQTRNDAQIGRAAKRAGWAGAALESAADDLDGACGAEGNPLTGLREAVQDEAKRVANLAEDIESHMSLPDGPNQP
jgi:hypothetical protein